MAGRILIIESVATRRDLLRSALRATFLKIDDWHSGVGFWSHVQTAPPDVIICAQHLVADVLKSLRSAGPRAADIGLIAVTKDTDQQQINTMLHLGAHDVVAQIDFGRLLLPRVRRLLRDRAGLLQLRNRCGQGTPFALQEGATPFSRPTKVAILSLSRPQAQAWAGRVASAFDGAVQPVDPQELFTSGQKQALIVPGSRAGLKVLPDILAHPETRDCAVLVISPPGREDLAQLALELGAGDVLTGGFDPEEAVLRLRHLLRLKNTKDALQAALSASVQAALSDQLTGLHNRRFALPALQHMAAKANETCSQFAVMLIDIDHFKAVNDRFGHQAGDTVLKAMAQRLRATFRQIDLVARIGGEEFLVAMPNTNPRTARLAAERLRQAITETAFVVDDGGQQIHVSISIGVTFGGPAASLQDRPFAIPKASDQVEQLLARADRALYRSKGNGRNRVTLSQSAA